MTIPRTQQAVDKLEYLTTFNHSVTQAMGVKQDTTTALRTAPIHLQSLFPDRLLIKAEEEGTRSEERRSSSHFNWKPGRFHPYASNPCVKKQECKICQAFMPAQLKQLSTPTYQSRKERELKKSSSDSPASVTPTLVDPADVSVLGRVHKESDGSSPAASKKKRADHSPTPKAGNKKKSSSSKARSDDIKDLDEK